MNNNPLYRKTEAILYNYNKVKAQIKNIELDIENIKNEFNGPGAIVYEERTQSTNSFNSSVENEVVNREIEINQLERYKRQKEIELLKVDNAIGSLTEREKIIIEMRYFKKYNNRMIAAKLDLAEEHICRIKNAAVNQILDSIF
ncbi:sigma factor-like helix-turn-helix DNA-binding protein [Clostridium sp.]|uniref:sigma factor-like helix-turn-helix DNA-binding protein n=1 Tax=Clostridium sp. TaxID=1506 RepID=UPI00290761CD|nr:sigma factor-like helix-turn-helix DNA-binding protein [Clostridium sp.]MDU7365403.1 sigma factor-like helix-turn-helix DNA-binding protein [Clostridium sp.]